MTEDKKQLFKFYFRMFNDGMLPPEEEYNFDSELGRRDRSPSSIAASISGSS